MTVYKNGKVIKQIPVTTGKPGFETRNGVKVVLGKEYFVRMRGTSVGIAEGSRSRTTCPSTTPPGVTWSGEYVHAAPWSVGLPGLRQRQPRLHGHEHRQRPVVLRHRPRGRHRQGRQLRRRHDGRLRQRLRRLEPGLEEVARGQRPRPAAQRTAQAAGSGPAEARGAGGRVRAPGAATSHDGPQPPDDRAPDLSGAQSLFDAQQRRQGRRELHRVHRQGHRRLRPAPGRQPRVLRAARSAAAPAGSGRSRP